MITSKFIVTTAFALTLGAGAANAATIGGIEFPDGDVSFADVVVGTIAGSPAATSPSFDDPNGALGVPDYTAGSVDRAFSLGEGGSIILQFTDNSLTGSGDAGHDLHVFEVGPATEATYVAISVDGIDFIEVGQVAGATASIDIDPFLDALSLDAFTRFAFVRLTDNGAISGGPGPTQGADIDAIGAISSAAPVVPVAAVPLPATGGLMLAGLVGFAAARRKTKA